MARAEEDRLRLLSGDPRRAVYAPLDDGSGRSEAVVRRLGSAIALGIIVDGEQLPAEAQLAASLNVAPSTLREALTDLRARGLVQTRRGRGGGSFVTASEDALTDLSRGRLRELGSTDLRELGDFHAAIAGAAARLAAQRASATEIGRLRDLLERLAAAGEGTEQRRIEGRYYIDVAAAAQSVRLTAREIELQSELGQVLWGAPRTASELAAAVERHHAVVDAIEDRDDERARAITEEHIAATTLRLIEVHVRLTRQARPAPGTAPGAAPGSGPGAASGAGPESASGAGPESASGAGPESASGAGPRSASGAAAADGAAPTPAALARTGSGA